MTEDEFREKFSSYYPLIGVAGGVLVSILINQLVFHNPIVELSTTSTGAHIGTAMVLIYAKLRNFREARRILDKGVEQRQLSGPRNLNFFISTVVREFPTFFVGLAVPFVGHGIAAGTHATTTRNIVRSERASQI